jgi:hypothetical protein
MLGGLTALLGALTDSSTTALIGSMDPVLCEAVAKLATHRNKSFITWSCPQVNVLVVTCTVIGGIKLYTASLPLSKMLGITRRKLLFICRVYYKGTETHIRLGNTPTSYSGGPGFKSDSETAYSDRFSLSQTIIYFVRL